MNQRIGAAAAGTSLAALVDDRLVGFDASRGCPAAPWRARRTPGRRAGHRRRRPAPAATGRRRPAAAARHLAADVVRIGRKFVDAQLRRSRGTVTFVAFCSRSRAVDALDERLGSSSWPVVSTSEHRREPARLRSRSAAAASSPPGTFSRSSSVRPSLPSRCLPFFADLLAEVSTNVFMAGSASSWPYGERSKRSCKPRKSADAQPGPCRGGKDRFAGRQTPPLAATAAPIASDACMPTATASARSHRRRTFKLAGTRRLLDGCADRARSTRVCINIVSADVLSRLDRSVKRNRSEAAGKTKAAGTCGVSQEPRKPSTPDHEAVAPNAGDTLRRLGESGEAGSAAMIAAITAVASRARAVSPESRQAKAAQIAAATSATRAASSATAASGPPGRAGVRTPQHSRHDRGPAQDRRHPGDRAEPWPSVPGNRAQPGADRTSPRRSPRLAAPRRSSRRARPAPRTSPPRTPHTATHVPPRGSSRPPSRRASTPWPATSATPRPGRGRGPLLPSGRARPAPPVQPSASALPSAPPRSRRGASRRTRSPPHATQGRAASRPPPRPPRCSAREMLHRQPRRARHRAADHRTRRAAATSRTPAPHAAAADGPASAPGDGTGTAPRHDPADPRQPRRVGGAPVGRRQRPEHATAANPPQAIAAGTTAAGSPPPSAHAAAAAAAMTIHEAARRASARATIGSGATIRRAALHGTLRCGRWSRGRVGHATSSPTPARPHLALHPQRQAEDPQEALGIGLVVRAASFHRGDRRVVEALPLLRLFTSMLPL